MMKRFIAGAVCPKCNERDKLKAGMDEAGNQHRECVSCGFEDRIVAGAPDELVTRVNQPREQANTQADISVVRILEPQKHDKDSD